MVYLNLYRQYFPLQDLVIHMPTYGPGWILEIVYLLREMSMADITRSEGSLWPYRGMELSTPKNVLFAYLGESREPKIIKSA